MVISSDIPLKGKVWDNVIEKFTPIFKPRVHYNIFMLALSIGVMYDKRIEKFDDGGEEPKTVPRTVAKNYGESQLDFIFQAAILSTTTEEIEEKRRLDLAFDESVDFNKIAFLVQFANFGVTKLEELIGDTDEESMENIKNFLVRSVDGENFDIDEISDEYLWEDSDLM